MGRPAARAASAATAKRSAGTHFTSAASAQRPPASDERRCAANATAAAARAPTSASLCPPPAAWTAITGFQPTNATASAASRAVRATAATAASIAPPRGLEEPGRGVGGVVDRLGDRLGDERERRPVDGRRVAPVRAEVRKRGALGVRRRRIDVRVAAAVGGDPAVAPVRPGVGREEERRRERDELDRGCDRDDEPQPYARAAEQQQPDEVRGERTPDQHEERPGAVRPRQAAVARDERRVVPPGERAAAATRARTTAPAAAAAARAVTGSGARLAVLWPTAPAWSSSASPRAPRSTGRSSARRAPLPRREAGWRDRLAELATGGRRARAP